MRPTKEQLEAYKEMAKTSPDSMKAMIEANLKATCDKFAGHEDRLDDCIDYLTECAKEILNSKNGEVPDEVCFKICRDYFNDEMWTEEPQGRKAKKKKAVKPEPKKTASQVEKEALEKENERIEKLKEKHGLKAEKTPAQTAQIQPEQGQLDMFDALFAGATA